MPVSPATAAMNGHVDRGNTSCHTQLDWISAIVLYLPNLCKDIYSAIRFDASEKRPRTLTGSLDDLHMTPSAVKSKDFPNIIDIKRVIPVHCFQAQTSVSVKFAVKDLSLAVVVYGLFLLVEYSGIVTLRCICAPVYWLLQGTIFWAIFVVGHDCGHNSFSRHQWFNDIVGTVLHAFIMVPYYPWKLSHNHHHKNTGNIDKDEIFYPVREKDSNHDIKPIGAGFGLGFAWFGYLFQGYVPRPVSHFNPFESMFARHVFGCVASLATMGGWAVLLLAYWRYFGFVALASHYAIPCFVFGSWLVVVTFLHHNQPGVPWYSMSVWSNVKGQLSTVDRHYGWAHDLTHNIGTHQIHHLFTKIPHYHLEEATLHFRKAFPHLVRICNDPILPTFFKMFNIFEAQRHIDNDTDVHVYY